MCHRVIANSVVSRFHKDRDIRKQWMFVVKRAYMPTLSGPHL